MQHILSINSDVPAIPKVQGIPNKGFVIDEIDPGSKRRCSLKEKDEPIGKSSISDTGIKESWGCRHTLAVMGFLGLLFVNAFRTILPIAIVAMVGMRSVISANGTLNQTEFCPPPTGYYDSLGHEDFAPGEFDWDEETQGLILGSMYWGVLVTTFLGARAAERFGGHLVYGVGMVTSSLLTIVIPFSARVSKECFIVIRVLSGIAQGVTYPALIQLLVSWIIPEDRSKFNSFIFSGSQIGTVLAMLISGWLIDSGFLGGWPLPFYVFGALGCLWGIPWFLLVRDSHENNPRVSSAEVDYLTSNKAVFKKKEAASVPWREMATSLPFWAILVAFIGFNFTFFLLLNGIPTYLANILYLDIKSNGVISAIPYLGMAAVGVVWGHLMNWLTQEKKVSIVTVRRVSTAFGCYTAMAGLIAVSFVGCDSNLTVIILCIAVSCQGTSYSGYSTSNQDIAPNLAGTLTGICSSVAIVQAILAPAITGFITQGNQTPAAWRVAFLIAASTIFVCCTFYLFFITDQVQRWNQPKKKNEGASP